MLADVYERLKAADTDPEVLDTSFGPAFASLGHRPGYSGPAPREPEPEGAGRPVRPPIPDLPGLSLRPDPGAAGTTGEFLDCLRNYRLWAGSPSFRVMSKNCERRFAPSTICTALSSDSMPSLEMVLAIVAACGGPREHLCEFATAWRRLVIPRQ